MHAAENNVMTTYVKCMTRASNTLDDDKSDAATIALAIESECSDEFRHIVELEGRTTSPDHYATYLKDMDAMQNRIAIKIVLDCRKDRAHFDEMMSHLGETKKDVPPNELGH